MTAEGAWENEEYTVRVRGKIREAVVFGTNLEMTREISTTLGEKCLRIHDRVENLSVDPSPLMVVYHTNPGFPVLGLWIETVHSEPQERRSRNRCGGGP